MVYCSNCGTKIDDEAYFCFKCGTKTQAGKTAKAMYPSDELRDAFYQVGLELEKAFTLAARETQAAFKKVSENMQQKTSSTQQTPVQNTVACTSCGTKNVSGAVFCSNCGIKVTSAKEPSGST
ncbi:MAG: zinc-ribbon domain-containing protein [Candidatus Bathyarchaeota archaeon]|nr:zinc-ribbon domain-containing protein [Candidatus Bathyarchaeota archaeon]